MLKVYEWLVYIIMRPHKSFQHLIKWFGIFIIAKTNYRKRKERLNRGKREKVYLPPRRSRPTPAQPAQNGHGGLLPPRAAKQLRGRAPTPWTPPRRPVPSRPPRAILSCPGEPP